MAVYSTVIITEYSYIGDRICNKSLLLNIDAGCMADVNVHVRAFHCLADV